VDRVLRSEGSTGDLTDSLLAIGGAGRSLKAGSGRLIEIKPSVGNLKDKTALEH
jgi:hypothetical protein